MAYEPVNYSNPLLPEVKRRTLLLDTGDIRTGYDCNTVIKIEPAALEDALSVRVMVHIELRVIRDGEDS
jgi:hypothetical protein